MERFCKRYYSKMGGNVANKIILIIAVMLLIGCGKTIYIQPGDAIQLREP
jgi:hypothetical protein